MSIGAALVANGCASEFERRFDDADRTRQEAAQKGFEWIGTADLLDEARTRAEAGETDAALALVDEARLQAEAALQQAERESEAWRGRVVR